MPFNSIGNLVWIDIEATGLDYFSAEILEVALLVTDKNLNFLHNGLDFVIHQPDEVLNNMEEWSQKHHQKSGLITASRESTLSLQDASDLILEEIKKYSTLKSSPLCGNSVYFDKYLLSKFLPQIDQYLNFQLIDVTTVRDLKKIWYPHIIRFKKSDRHRALPDIKESVGELRYLKKEIFK
ncbi:MAG TPA: oligoribonuclease [Patescibacteria group bacterium]